jgi:uncharacterized protein (TIGR02145 family)
MKKIILICSALVFAFTIFQEKEVNAQDYQITFAGTGASTTVSSVEVENLSTGAKKTLNEGDILHLTSVVGIPQFETNNSSGMRIYPNPMMDNSILELHPQEAGEAVITVYERTGKTVAKLRTYLENGRQEFRLSGLKSGLYLINVTGNTFQCSGKILSSGQADGNPGIEKVSNTNESNIEKISKKEFSEIQGTVDMYYNEGERLKFKAISGIYSTVKTDIPTEDKNFSFNFIPCTDGDNNNYPVVEIGSQIWMEENLKTTKNINSELIGTTTPDTFDISVEETPIYQWAYDGNEKNVPAYGRLYTWYAASNACPTGWHIPNNFEWDVLMEYLGGQSIVGGKLKESGLAYWDDPNTGASNEAGFTALPGGIRDINGSFDSIASKGEWWSVYRGWLGSRSPMGMQMGFDFSDVRGIQLDGKYGFSVRCLSDSIKAIPSLNTWDATEITTTSAISGGEISDDFGYPVTTHGVCWSSIHTPTISDSLTSDATGTGAFTSSLTGLQPNLTYYIRAYATNSQGTSYGNLITFKTFPLWPTVSTNPISSVTIKSAISGGDVTNIGGGVVTTRGICWSSLHTPTITDSLTSDGTGAGTFASSLTGLFPNTIYSVRAYAINSYGTGYGNEIFFITRGEISDIDGNTYSSLKIGTQTWMAENLKTTKYNDGTVIPLVKDSATWATLSTPGYCWNNNDSDSYKDSYGALYNLYAVNTVILCPVGWHVPSDSEWTVLSDFLGGESIAGGKLKDANLTHWESPNQDATNETGFTALPGGARDSNGVFYYVGYHGGWWSSTEVYTVTAWIRNLDYNSGILVRDRVTKQMGLSVRCLKDN